MRNSEYLPAPTEGQPLHEKRGNGRKKIRGDWAAASADRLLPHSLEAEQGVLGCVFLDVNECMSVCEERAVAPEWFYDLKHQVIWMALKSLYDAGAAIDVITVQEWLKGHGGVEQVGGIGYLAGLPDGQWSAAMVGQYLDIVREKERRRRIIRDCAEVVSRAYEAEEEVEPLVIEYERNALSLSEESSGRSEQSIKEVALAVLGRFESNYVRGHAQVTGMTTGLSYFDKVSGGLGGENGHYIVLAGRPGDGKTSLALLFLLHAAVKHEWYSAVTVEEFNHEGTKARRPAVAFDGANELPEGYVWAKDGSVIFQKHVGIPCAFFSLEMTSERLVERMLFQHSGCDLQRFRTGFANTGDFDKLIKSGIAVAKSTIWLDDTPRLNMDMLKARARRMVRQYGIKLFVVDYIQLLKSIRHRHQRPDRVAELEEISAEFQALGKELGVDFIILAQLNRDVAKGDRFRAPEPSDIKSCGAIEQDADQIILLYRPKMGEDEKEAWEEQVRAVRVQAVRAEHPDWTPEQVAVEAAKHDWSKRFRRVNARIGKNRYGMEGDVELVLDGASTHFHDYGDWLKSHGLRERAAGESKRPEQTELGDDPAENFPEP